MGLPTLREVPHGSPPTTPAPPAQPGLVSSGKALGGNREGVGAVGARLTQTLSLRWPPWACGCCSPCYCCGLRGPRGLSWTLMGGMSAWTTGGSCGRLMGAVAELVLRLGAGSEGRDHGAEGREAWGQPGGWWIVRTDGGKAREGEGRGWGQWAATRPGLPDGAEAASHISARGSDPPLKPGYHPS